MADAIYSPDVVVVGGGVAGLTVALNLAPRKVCIITKSCLLYTSDAADDW